MRNVLLATCLTAASLTTASPGAAATGLELHRIMLSAAGVGYFEYGAHVDGDAQLGLNIPLAQVDDVLRSLAVFDSHGGVGSIELPGRDNMRQAFADVPFTEDTLQSPAALLDSLRGEEISVAGPAAMTGRIVGTSSENVVPAPQATVIVPATHTRVTLLTAGGLRQFILEDAASVQWTDAALRARVGAALDAARQQSAASQRHLTLHASGAVGRDITVGYVAVAPLWKASYRVVLPAEGADHARVQGWAVLENQSGADWHGVDLTLQSGNPVTFHQAIYASYYANRPEVPVEVLGQLLPDADMRGVASPFQSKAARFQLDNVPGGMIDGRRRNFAAPPQMAMLPQTDGRPLAGDFASEAAPPPPPPPDLAQPDQAAEAAATVVGATFHIATPIDLARGHTASVPIIDREIPAEQLDWLQTNSTRPVTALRITNDAATGLPAGVLTLYAQNKGSGTEFSGDARLSGLPAGESRLLAFAEDLQTSAERTDSNGGDTLIDVKMAKGVLTQSLRHRRDFTATLTAPVHEARRILVEFPKAAGATFTVAGGGEAQEATVSAWRVLVNLQPNETRQVRAHADITFATATSLLPGGGDFEDPVLLSVLSQRTLDGAARAKLQNLADLRATESDKQAAVQSLTAQREGVLQDEDRLRKNLEAVTTQGNLHDKLLSALEVDETTLSQLRHDMDRARSDADAAHATLAKAVQALVL
jgi:hypothetical protein